MFKHDKYFNGAVCRYIVGEIACVVIALETSDRKYEPRGFHFRFHIRSSDRPYVYLQSVLEDSPTTPRCNNIHTPPYLS